MKAAVADPVVILNVDDDAANRYVVTRILRRAGFDVREAGTGEQALSQALHGPDLIVLDIRMPDLSGFDVCRRLKSDPKTASIPVLHLTATFASSEYWAASLEGGADAYLASPVDASVLVATVRALLRARAAEAEARSLLALWQKTFDAMAHGVRLLDASGEELRRNAAMARVPSEADWQVVWPPGAGRAGDGGPPGEPWVFRRCRESGRRESLEVRAFEHCYEVSAEPVVGADGVFLGAVETVVDITERRVAENERARLLAREREARGEAEAANRLKDEFLATLSHELRTPLNAIVGWASVLSSGGVDEATAARAIEAIERNARAQSKLIEDILDVSRIISGRLRLEAAPCNVAAVVDAALDAVRPAAQAKGLTLEARLDPSLRVHGDAERLQQIVWNLLVNAVKFTPNGGRVEVALDREAKRVRLVVSDTGEGIDPAFLPHVFERFRTADASTTRQRSGLGLGLAIVRHLVELHGGCVSTHSEGRGRGATFTVLLPLPEREPPAAPPAPDPPRAADPPEPSSPPGTADAADALPRLDGVRVVVIEDEPDTLSLLETVLRRRGAQVWPARTAQEGWEALQAVRPDALVTDIGLPERDGYSLIRAIRALPDDDGGRTPVAALTAYARESDRVRALAAGFDDHAAKPVSPDELVRLVARLAWARRSRARRAP